MIRGNWNVLHAALVTAVLGGSYLAAKEIPDVLPAPKTEPETGTRQRTLPPEITTAQAVTPVSAPALPEDSRRCTTDSCPTSKDECCPKYLFPQDGRLRVRGWLDGGMIYNSSNPGSRFNGPYNAVDRNQEPMFNQAYLIIERTLPCAGEFGVGGRIDLLYGEDFILGESNGLEKGPGGNPRWNPQYYGVAIPQAYGEFGNERISAKVGHFYSIVGYECLQSTSNFFYTHSYSYQFGGPFTHWGALGTWKINDNLQVQSGLTNGWNTLDGSEDHVSFIGGIKYTPTCKNWWTSYAITTGQEFTNPAGLAGVANVYANRTRYSLLLGLDPTDRLEYVFHHFLGVQENGAVGGGPAMWYGIDQYLYFKLADRLRAGARFEWFRDEEGTRVGLNRPSNPNKPPFPGSFYSATLGLNWSPLCNLMIRPEARWDWFDGQGRPYNDGRRDSQFLLGLDVILLF